MTRLRRWLGEPLLHFLLLGALLYAAAAQYARTHDPLRIVVTSGDVEMLRQRYLKQFGSLPDERRLSMLIDDYIQDEALYRQGIAMGLEVGDEVVRRRIVQKMDFLSEGDTIAADEPGDEQLRGYYQAHSDRYREPARVSFTQLYFSPDRDGEAAAQTRAAAALAKLRAGAPIDAVGADPFSDGTSFALLDQLGVERVFGAGQFASSVMRLPTDDWSGPIRSGYGWHLVRVDARAVAQALAYADAADAVRADWQDDQRAQSRRRMLAALLKRYEVVRDYRSAPKQ